METHSVRLYWPEDGIASSTTLPFPSGASGVLAPCQSQNSSPGTFGNTTCSLPAKAWPTVSPRSTSTCAPSHGTVTAPDASPGDLIVTSGCTIVAVAELPPPPPPPPATSGQHIAPKLTNCTEKLASVPSSTPGVVATWIVASLCP